MVFRKGRSGRKYSRKIYDVESWRAATVQCFRFNGLKPFLVESRHDAIVRFDGLRPFDDLKK